MSEIAASVDNFGAHLAEMDAGGMDASDSGDSGFVQNDFSGGRQQAQQLKQATRQQQEHVNPQQRVDSNGKPLQLNPDGTMAEGDEAPSLDAEVVEEVPQDGDWQGPNFEDLQGMYKALEAPDLHEGLWDKTIPTPVNGVTVPKSIRELRDGYMRMSDYSRKSGEATNLARQAHAAMQQTRAMFERMNDPNVIRATFRKLGPQHQQAFFQAARLEAQEWVKLQRATPTEREAILRAQELERRAEQAEEMARRRQQEPQRPAHEQYQPQIHSTLEQVLPQVWQRHRLAPSPVAMEEFTRHIQHVWDGRMETIPQAVERATIATIEVLGDRAAQHQQYVSQQGQRQMQAQPLPARRLPAGAPPRQSGPAPRNNDFRTSNFGNFLKKLG